MGFTLTVRLGRGLTVETFAAVLEHAGDRMDVAIKRPRPELKNIKPFADALKAWGTAQVELDDEALVAVLEAGELAEGVYVIQERVEGPALAKVLERLKKSRRAFKPELALHIAERICRGLLVLHGSAQKAHGGLDPGEVLISYRGQVKLGDQGLHRLDWLAGDGIKQPPTYLAPEIAGGGEPSPESDVYAFGLITLEVLIGQPIWEAETMSVEDSIEALRDFSHIGQAQRDLTYDLVELITRSVQRDPKKRFPSAAELHANLTGLMSKYSLAADEKALGLFVRSLVPRPKQEEAPTMIAGSAPRIASDPGTPEPQQLKAMTVMVDPELEVKAKKRAATKPMAAPSTRPPAKPLAKPLGESMAVEKSLARRANEFLTQRPEIGWKMLAAGGAIVLLLLVLVMRRIFGVE